MRLEQWSNIRNIVKEQRNIVARDLDKMEASVNSYDELLSKYPKYKDAEMLWMKYDYIINHMDFNFTTNEILRIDY